MSDIRALLLTDIVDAIRLCGALGDAAAAALGDAHDRVARDLLQAWRGREIDRSDGMLMLFDTAGEAAGYALAYHQALAALEMPLQARAGLHVGAVGLRANAPQDIERGAKPVEVEGIAKPIAARVMSLALAGQTLMTAEAREALGRTPLRVQSHGHWRIKGVAEPIELFEVGDRTSPFTPPTDSPKVYRVVPRGDLWLPLRQVEHSLPAERDAFVGRHEPLADLAARFEAGARLVSLLGIGGTGKTRIATRFAWQWLGDFAGGVWFCDLSPARGLDGIVHAVAQGLEIPLGIGDPVVQLGNAIAGRGACLVILDNFEQVARHAEDTLGRWLDRAGEARFLVTTREVLGLAGEEALALAPLAPSDAGALFVQRAAAASGGLELGADDEAAIPQLVKLLDGLPLAIELAAARARVMSPRALLARMDQRFRLLAAVGGRQDRQATLRATFDWSWELLSEPEKSALAQLSVFEGGFTLEAAEAVLDLAACADGAWIVDVLQSLVDKSFVRPTTDGRFGLLGTVQEYAAEHLRTPGRYPASGPDALMAAHERHGAYFARLKEDPGKAGHGADVDNLVVACRRATTRGDASIAVATLQTAWAALKLQGPFRAGVELARATAAMPGLGAPARAAAALVAAGALDATGQVDDAQSQFSSALAHARTACDPWLEARALTGLGGLHANEARIDEALLLLGAALSVARGIPDPALECDALNGLGSAYADLGRLDEARSNYAAALVIARRVGDRRWEGGLLGNLGGLLFDQGRLAEAAEHFQAGLVVARELGNRMWEGNALCNLGALHQTQGRFDEALVESEAALDIARALGHARLECIARGNLGLVHCGLRRWGQAHAAFDSGLSLARELQDRRSEGLLLGYLGRLHANQSRFESARDCLRRGEELLHEARDRFSLGLLLCNRVEVERLAGAAQAADSALAQATDIAVELGAGPESELGVALARAGTTSVPTRRPERGALLPDVSHGPTGS